ncbi:HD-GYP domain-containing protein [Mesobacillus zeae]|uniref:HD-GYP domain-containing protein n=1 Tax=Mesobacillus zeae TaxID=1917180 RepID=UPI00300889D2
MQLETNDARLRTEEQRALIWFLGLFYVIFILYDFFYYYIYKKYVMNIEPGLPSDFGYWYYLFVFLLIPITYAQRKSKRIYLTKYILISVYIVMSIINDAFTYLGSDLTYQTGNIVEVFFILFTPIFVNKNFFRFVFTGIAFKYIMVGLILKSWQVLLPLTILMIIFGIAFVMLGRFQGYVGAITSSYEKQLSGIVKGIITTIELKDPYTRGHSERVAHYAGSLAKNIGKFSDVELNDFHNACLLHDIGKVNIPDKILMKPGKLTLEEYQVIQTHPEAGAEAIKKINGLGNSIEVIRFHHERWDGKGYPHQLVGERIPLLARIVSIADAFDAMTSSRSYRAAMSCEEAYRRILEGQGTQFDPTLLQYFIEVYPQWVEFHKNYASKKASESK